jgi:hypothetical protein
MTTDNICGICCVNYISDSLSCIGCLKSVCVDCYNNTREKAKKDIIDKPDNINNVLITEIININENINCSYRCPYCRYDNIKNYDELSKNELLIFFKKDYMTYKEIETANIRLRIKLGDLEDELRKQNEAISFEEGEQYLQDCLRRKDAEIVKMASNFSFMISMMTDFENIKRERQNAVCELKQIRENYKLLETDNIIKRNKLQDINNIIISKLPPKKAIDKLRKETTILPLNIFSVNINYEISKA